MILYENCRVDTFSMIPGILNNAYRSVDPWLLKHNRLCPVCKRDTLKKPRTIKQNTIG